MKKRILTLLAAACVASCIYPFDPELPAETEKTVVVDGRILIGGISTVRLGYLTPINSDNLSAWPNGKAWIEDDLGNTYQPIESNGNFFNFQSTQEIGALPEGTTPSQPLPTSFRAVAQVDGETYSSEWISPNPAPVIKDIQFEADDYSVKVLADIDPGEGGSGYLGFLFDETWRFHAEVYPEYYINPETWTYGNYMELQSGYQFYWCWRSFSPGQVTLFDYSNLRDGIIQRFPIRSFSRTDTRCHQRYSILVKAFSLSKAEYEYNKQTQEISEIGGDLFSPDPGAIPGNLVCETNPERQVLGNVLAGWVTQKRAFCNTSQYIINRPPSVAYQKVKREDFSTFYFQNRFRPAIMYDFDDGADIGWVHIRCIDCTEAGGTQQRPWFWED